MKGFRPFRRPGDAFDEYKIPIRPDAGGYVGRECPQQDCEGYFKIMPGTGLTGDLPCRCPYCGHVAEHSHFFTKEQIEYAKSVVANQVFGAALDELKELEFDIKPRGDFGIGFSMKVEGQPPPVRHYRERQLETKVECDKCGLRYTIYGVFAHCPDCGTHNSLQILNKNLELAEKQIELAKQTEGDLTEHLVADALENCVSSFDGFGRESCKIRADLSSEPDRAKNLSFQNLSRAREQVQRLFGCDLTSSVTQEEWETASRSFQKRHLLAHKMGVVDEEYKNRTNDPEAIVGRKVSINAAEVKVLVAVLKKLGAHLIEALPEPSSSPEEQKE